MLLLLNHNHYLDNKMTTMTITLRNGCLPNGSCRCRRRCCGGQEQQQQVQFPPPSRRRVINMTRRNGIK